jgi:ubiquinone/menaquinone biosynthesis C-methylase UbiE
MAEVTTTNLFGSNEEHLRCDVMQEIYGEFTKDVLTESGISQGLNVLDLGCGQGTLSAMLADLVGPTGSVTGLDKNQNLIALARHRADAAGARHVRFMEADLNDVSLPIDDEQYDAVVARLVLFALKDPIETIRRMSRQLSPGGRIVLMELDNQWLQTGYRAWPTCPLVDKLSDLFLTAARQTGLHLDIAVNLYPTLIAAGLVDVRLRMHVRMGGDPDFIGYKFYPTHTRLFEAEYIKLGLVKPGELEVETLAHRLRQELASRQAFMVLPPMIAGWARRPA